jgi:hypothetical protein
MIDGNIEMSNSTHHRIAEVGVTVQPAYTDHTTVVNGDKKGFPWLVEAVDPRSPVIHQADETMKAVGNRLRYQAV